MKLEVHRTNLGEMFDPNKNFETDKVITLNKHPTNPTDAASKGYLDKKEEEFYNTANIKGPIYSTKILQVKGPDVIHTDESLVVKEVNKEVMSGSVFKVDIYGRIIGIVELKDEDLDTSTKLNWGDITDKPKTLEGYGIADLVPSDKNTELTGKVSAVYQNRTTKSPVPYSHIVNKYENSGYGIVPGMMVIKINKPDAKKWKVANGSIIYRKDYPKAVDFLAGSTASQAKLPDARHHDSVLLETYGVEATTYVRVDG